MIKRHYVFSAKKPHEDGLGSYGFYSFVITHTSWLAQPEEMFSHAKEHALEYFRGGEGIPDNDSLLILAFNRI